MEQKSYSIKEVIGITANMLRGISVPAEYAEEIGMPVMHAIRNLKVVLQTMEAQEVAEEIQNDEPESPGKGENDE